MQWAMQGSVVFQAAPLQTNFAHVGIVAQLEEIRAKMFGFDCTETLGRWQTSALWIRVYYMFFVTTPMPAKQECTLNLVFLVNFS